MSGIEEWNRFYKKIMQEEKIIYKLLLIRKINKLYNSYSFAFGNINLYKYLCVCIIIYTNTTN